MVPELEQNRIEKLENDRAPGSSGGARLGSAVVSLKPGKSPRRTAQRAEGFE